MNSILSLLRSRFNTAAAALAAVLLATPAAHAASAAWLGTTDSLWSTAGNWSGSTIPGVGNTATFNGTGSGNTTIDVGTISLANITFDTSSAAAYTLGATPGTGTITFGNASTTAVTMNSTVTNSEIINANLTLGNGTANTTTFTNDSTGLLTLGGNITGGTGGIAAAKVVTFTGAGNTTVGGVIGKGGASSLALTKSGTGTLTLSGTNTYAGTTTLSAGTLAYGADNAISTGGVTVNGAGAVLAMGSFSDSVGAVTLTAGDITGSGTLTSTSGFTMNNNVATSVSAILAGSVNLTKTGTNTLTLSGANTYTGTTTLSAGTLSIGSDANLSGTSSALTFNGGTLQITGTTLTALNTGRTTTFTANKTVGFDIADAGNTFTVSQTLNQISGNLTKSGAGTLLLTASNTYTGNTTISAGTLTIGNSSALGASLLAFNGGALSASSALGTIANAMTLFVNSTVSGSNNITLGGNFTTAVANALLTNSLDAGKVLELSGNIFLSELVATARTLTIGGTGNTTISGVIANFNGAGVASNFAVTNTGVTTLTNANTYTGNTQVKAEGATLRLSGAGKIVGPVVATAGTLDFNGTTQTITTLQLGGGASGSTGNVLIGNGTLNLGGTVSYLSTNNPNGGTISGEGGGVLNLNATRTFTIPDSTAAANDLTVSAIIADGTGSNGITKGSPGVLALTGANTYTGNTTIAAGTISVSNLKNGGVASSLGMSSNAATNLVFGNATTLAYTGTGDTTDRLFTITGSGNGLGATLDASGFGAINFSNTGSMAFTTANQTRTLTLAGTNVGNNILAAALANNGSGATSLTKTGGGTWALSGTNTYTGVTTVTAGTLVISGGGNLTGTTKVEVAGGSLLIGANEVINNSATVTLGGTIAMGGAFTETLGALTLSANSTLDFGGSSGNTFKFTSFTPGANILNINNWTYNVNHLIFTASQAGNLGNFSFENGLVATEIDVAGGFEIIAVPEPTTIMAAIFLLAGLAIVERKRLKNYLLRKTW